MAESKCAFPGWGEGNGWCSVTRPSVATTPEVTDAKGIVPIHVIFSSVGLLPLQDSNLAEAVCTQTFSSCKMCPATGKPVCTQRCSYGGPTPLLLLSQQWNPCFFCRLRPLPAVTWLCGFDPQSLVHCSLASSGCFHKANLSSLSQTAELTSKARVSMPTPCPSVSGCRVLGGSTSNLCHSLTALPSSDWLLPFF